VVTQVDGSTWKVTFQMHAGNVLSCTSGLHTEQLSGVLVCRRDIFSPGPDFIRAAPGLALSITTASSAKDVTSVSQSRAACAAK
jgi:hypothetical protein